MVSVLVSADVSVVEVVGAPLWGFEVDSMLTSQLSGFRSRPGRIVVVVFIPDLLSDVWLLFRRALLIGHCRALRSVKTWRRFDPSGRIFLFSCVALPSAVLLVTKRTSYNPL